MWRSLRCYIWLAVFIAASQVVADVLQFKNTTPGQTVKSGTELRILCVGDSITVGFRSDKDGGDGNGYRLQLRDDLYKDNLTYAGNVTSDGTMLGGYFAAWSGKTIQYMANHIDASLAQRPNIVLIHAGTNDMAPKTTTATEGNDPTAASERLGNLIDKVIEACPDATVLVAMIINSCDKSHYPRTTTFQNLIPGVVKQRSDNGSHVLAVNFTSFPTSSLHGDCIHPTNVGYQLFGDYWYDFITQIPKDWINTPVGVDPNRVDGLYANGGPDPSIPAPQIGKSPVQITSSENITSAAATALNKGHTGCTSRNVFTGTGEIFQGGVGYTGDWKYHQGWTAPRQVASGYGLDRHYVRLHDMDGDGKADYLWLDPMTGAITCSLNLGGSSWKRAGNNNGLIATGEGKGNTVFLADINGDGLTDYLIAHPENGSVSVWWNGGASSTQPNGWKWVHGGQITAGVSHANLATLKFPDINGDGRADYVYIGEEGDLKHFLNIGTRGGSDVQFAEQGGIFKGATSAILNIVFADINGDGRDDYLVWDKNGGLTGFLNQPTQNEGVPQFIEQGTLASGNSQNPTFLRLADLDGDGKDDYVYVDEHGGLLVSYNRGTGDTTTLLDGLHFADIDGDGIDDYIWLDPATRAPTVYINNGPDTSNSLGWSWKELNVASPIGEDVETSQVQFGDVNGDGLDDYLVLNPVTGALTAFINLGSNSDIRWSSTGVIANGRGPGANVRIADIDGDGIDDYIYVYPNGSTNTFRNLHTRGKEGFSWKNIPQANANAKVGRLPEEISFSDINNDGKADYIWTSSVNGSVHVYLNNYPNQPMWLDHGVVTPGVDVSGSSIRYATLLKSGYSDYVIVNPQNGTFAAQLNSCST